MVIDFHVHVHCFPDDLAKRAIPVLAAKAGILPRLNGTITDLYRSMQGAGISLSVIQPVATHPRQVRKINDWAADQNIGERGLLFFASFHPDLSDPFAEIKRIKRSGLPGVQAASGLSGFFR